jgi:radical SAM protein with 4Fe4S-binding SPASM domain
MMIEPTDLCNLNCGKCYNQIVDRKREKHFLSFKDFKKIIDEIKNHCIYINLWFAGEPLLNKEVEKMISYANSKGVIVCMSTNAMLLDKDRIENLAQAGFSRMIISFDGATRETYEEEMTGANHATVLDNIRTLTSMKHKIVISLQLVATQKNEGEIEAFERLARSLNVDEAYVKSLNLAEHVDKRASSIISSLVPQNKELRRRTEDREGNCVAKVRSVVLCDGTVVACSYDAESKLVFGNALKDRFRDIWRSDKYSSFRNDNDKFKKYDICAKCGCKRDCRIINLF